MMDAEEIAHLRRLREQYERNVWRLKEQAAEHGLEVPLSITNGIEEFEAKIAELDKQLAAELLASVGAQPPAGPVVAAVSAPVAAPPPSAAPVAAPPGPSATPQLLSIAAPRTGPLAMLPREPRYLVLYGGIAALVVGLLLLPFSGPQDSPLSQFVGVLFILGFAAIIAVVWRMVAQWWARRGQ
jgi:hypothetical protein